MMNIFKNYYESNRYKDMPLTEGRYVVVDTELTGLDEKKDSIVSIGAVRMTGGRIDLSDTFHKLINPETALTAESIIIHGIMPSEVIAEPCIDSVLMEFSQFCGTDVIVGHFVSIDMSFINREMKRITGLPMQNPVLDTFTIYEWIRKRGAIGNKSDVALPLMRDPKLYKIARYFEIPFNGGHDAAIDSFITAQIFQRFIPMLIESGIQDMEYLLMLDDPFRGGDRFRAAAEMSHF
ncbi:MAG: 3'-5' exonuclease [Nitrospirae bacterium]|nr:MAG: 3'-5' exonuclease [Nitrospirota bacterium]